MQFKPKALGLTVGILGGAWWLVMMAVSLMTGFGMRTLSTLGSYHPMFSYSWSGALWMAVLHLVGGFIFGWVFASLYNKLAE